jgi:Zn-dependent protease
LLLLRFVGFGWIATLSFTNALSFNLAYFLILFLYYGVYMNLTLAIFNLLPFPPLDGSRILFYFLPPRLYFKIAPYEQYITLAVMALLLLGPLSSLISTLTTLIMRAMFALTGMTGFLI